MVIVLLLISFIALLWASDHLINGASHLAVRFKIHPFIIGLTIVALGATIPELAISVAAALKAKNALSIGNAIGDNIANIGLVLGVILLINPLALEYSILSKSYPILLITMLFAYSLMLDGFLSRTDGVLLLIACLIVITFLIYQSSISKKRLRLPHEFKIAVSSTRSSLAIFISIAVSIIVIPISSNYVVHNAAEIARWFGISELTIGLTIISIGTTLPELITSIIAAIKREEEIAIGTILGSNIYNILLVLAFPAIINPEKINMIVVWRDMPIMIGLTIFLFFLIYHYKKKLSHWHGGILLIIYCSYIASLVIKAHR